MRVVFLSLRVHWNLFIIVAIWMLLTTSTGCATSKIVTQKDVFFQNNPDEALKYKKFNVISFGAWESSKLEEYSAVTTVLRVIKQKFPENEEVIDYVDSLNEVFLKGFEERKGWIKGISNEDSLPGDEIYFFEYHTDQVVEYGVLVLNDGKIRERYIEIAYPN